MRYSITVLGDEKIRQELLRKSRRANNLSPAFRFITKDFRSMMRRQFDTQGAYIGGGWAPLAASTVAQKARQGHDSRILHRTRAMRKSFTTGTRGLRELGRDELSFDTEVAYAGIHQKGWAKLPQRKIFEFNRRTSARWRGIIQNYVMRGHLKAPPL